MMAKLITYLRDHSQVLKYVFFAFLLFTIVFDYFAERHEPHFFGDTIIGFWSIFGTVVCLAMVVVFKGLYNNWLKQDEDYYDK
ncbi:MAG: hypothetical protein WC799_07995 [Desulfobacteraceae bacterium]|jgi:hypothetical protein